MEHSNLNIYYKVKKGKNVHVAENGDTGEKTKPYQSNPVIWIYRFLNPQRQDPGSYYFELLKAFHRERLHIFCPKKHTAFGNIRNCMLKRDMEFDLSIYL